MRRVVTPGRRGVNSAAGCALCFGVNLIIAPGALGSVLGPLRFYLNLLLIACLVAQLSHRQAGSRRWLAIDTRLGDVAYPIYLIHMQVGLLVLALGFAPEGQGASLFLASFVPVLFFSWLMVRIVDDPIERARAGIKRKFLHEQSDRK